jgi:hypothetical protein
MCRHAAAGRERQLPHGRRPGAPPAAAAPPPAGFGEGRHLSLRSINHISKVCSSVEASVAFYRDVLGFILVKRPQSFNDSFQGCW